MQGSDILLTNFLQWYTNIFLYDTDKTNGKIPGCRDNLYYFGIDKVY